MHYPRLQLQYDKIKIFTQTKTHVPQFIMIQSTKIEITDQLKRLTFTIYECTT